MVVEYYYVQFMLLCFTTQVNDLIFCAFGVKHIINTNDSQTDWMHIYLTISQGWTVNCFSLLGLWYWGVEAPSQEHQLNADHE